ncbi:hypothetical protein C5C31_13255 [Rathayibacter rathayi]|nr:hypothetical protein C5C02_08450 [Rathayibacter rathayi]PPG73193.1 hypothetical protein C5C23_14605 [Rathayibacter rathayi]PPH19493.1 hypothetical protein C5C31_13255 [Rathayibacter rathayi]PPI75421.1 hypothetical protein C5E03_13880 [Rathayibacter rathayi]
MQYANPADAPEYAVKLQGLADTPDRLSERWAQIHLDASANASTRYPDHGHSAYNTYLHDAEEAMRRDRETAG